MSCGVQGFLCRDDVALENSANDGCLIQCNEGWKLVADPRNGGSWHCTNISTPICPGKFNTGERLQAQILCHKAPRPLTWGFGTYGSLGALS